MFSINGKWVSYLLVEKYFNNFIDFNIDMFRESDRYFYGYYPDDADAGKGRVYPCKTIYKKSEEKN